MTMKPDGVELLVDCEMQLRPGNLTWRVMEFAREDDLEDIVQVATLGNVETEDSVPCRMHSACYSAHVLLSVECDCLHQFMNAHETMEDAGVGISVYFPSHEGRGFGIEELVTVKKIAQEEGLTQAEVYQIRNGLADKRDFELGASVLTYLRVSAIDLITDNPFKREDLEFWGVRVHSLISQNLTHEHQDWSAYRADRPGLRMQAGGGALYLPE